MKVVGIITETKQMRYVVLSGSISAPSRGAETLRPIPYPPNIDTGAGLSAMLKTIAGLVSSLQPCKIANHHEHPTPLLHREQVPVQSSRLRMKQMP